MRVVAVVLTSTFHDFLSPFFSGFLLGTLVVSGSCMCVCVCVCVFRALPPHMGHGLSNCDPNCIIILVGELVTLASVVIGQKHFSCVHGDKCFDNQLSFHSLQEFYFIFNNFSFVLESVIHNYFSYKKNFKQHF
jgi:hypothetical protein